MIGKPLKEESIDTEESSSIFSRILLNRNAGTGQYEQKYLEIDIVQPKPGIHFLLEYDKSAEIETKIKANCEKNNLNLFPP